MDQPIDIKKTYEATKKRMSLETKIIKSMSIYNFLNDTLPNLFIDCRDNFEEKFKLEKECYILNSFVLKKFPYTTVKIKPDTRLVLIMNEKQSLKEDKELEKLREYIKNENNIKELYVTNDYSKFTEKYPYLLINDNSSKEELLLAQTNYPIMILDDLLYIGSFFNSKNLTQIEKLGIKTIVTLAANPDTELKKKFENLEHFEVDEEGHGEIDYLDIIFHLQCEIEKKNTPIMIYCFSGKSVSVAVIIAFLMRFKKWPLQLATGFLLKLVPNCNLPAWLFSQLSRIDFSELDK